MNTLTYQRSCFTNILVQIGLIFKPDLKSTRFSFNKRHRRRSVTSVLNHSTLKFQYFLKVPHAAVDFNLYVNCKILFIKGSQKFGILKRTCHFFTCKNRRRVLYLAIV